MYELSQGRGYFLALRVQQRMHFDEQVVRGQHQRLPSLDAFQLWTKRVEPQQRHVLVQGHSTVQQRRHAEGIAELQAQIGWPSGQGRLERGTVFGTQVQPIDGIVHTDEQLRQRFAFPDTVRIGYPLVGLTQQLQQRLLFHLQTKIFNVGEKEMTTLVFDLDETLVHTTEKGPGRDRRFGRPPDYDLGDLVGWLRPGMAELLPYVFKRYRVVVWTAGTREYANEIVPIIFGQHTNQLAAVLAAEDCGQRLENHGWHLYAKTPYKPLCGQGLDMARTLIIDDRAETASDNIENLILMPVFNEDDDYLLRLVQFLNRHRFDRLGDVRSVDKTAWWF